MFLTLLKNILLKQYMLLFETNKKNKQKTKIFFAENLFILVTYLLYTLTRIEKTL